MLSHMPQKKKRLMGSFGFLISLFLLVFREKETTGQVFQLRNTSVPDK